MQKLFFIAILFMASCGPAYDPTIRVRDIDPQSLRYDTPIIQTGPHAGQMTPYMDSIYKMNVTWKQAFSSDPWSIPKMIGLTLIGIFIAIGIFVWGAKSEKGIKPGHIGLGIGIIILFCYLGYTVVDSQRNDNNFDHPIRKQDYQAIQASGGDFSQFWDTIKLH